jgi:hypothetical protein
MKRRGEMADGQDGCQRAKSSMTPCYLRDGEMVVATAFGGRKVCVGCEASVERIKREQEAKQPAATPSTDDEK